MKDYLNLGCTPHNEECQQVGENFDPEKAQEECERFIRLLRHVHGPEPVGARLAVKWFPHDFGSYPEVVCWYEESDEDEISESAEYAYKVEANTPESWLAEVN
jgi:hypothetical protein